MDRNREARRTTMAANGLSRRRPRSSSLRDSPEEDGPVELQEPTRLRDRGTGKKDRERERERDRERDRDRLSRSSKRRRGDRLMHGSNREDGGDDTSEESVNDEEEDEDDDGTGGSVRMLPLNPSLSSSSLLNHRKSFPPAKVFRAAPVWKAADEMIGVSVPRKARSASTKRSHECWASSGGIVAEPIHRQASTSPVRTSASAMGMGASQSPASPSSSNASVRKKIKPNGPKLRPPKSSSKSSSSAQDEIEIEIAEVLYGMMRQPQGPTRQEIMANDSREANNKSSSDGKSRVSSPISNPQSAQLLSSSVPPQNSSSSAAPLSAVAPKRKRPRPVKYDEESSAILTVRSSLISSTTKAESDQPSKVETCPPNFDKNSGSAAENGALSYDLTNSLAVPVSSEAQPESIKLESNISSDSKALIEESERQDAGLGKEEPHSPKAEKDTLVPRLDDDRQDVKATKANQALSESENKREEKFHIDLMAPPPPQRSSPERDVEINFVADAKPITIDAEREVKPLIKQDEKSLRMGKEDGVAIETERVRAMAEEAEAQKPVSVQKERNIDLQLDLEKADRDSGNGNVVGKRHNQNSQRQQQQQPNSEKAVQSNSLPLPMSVPSWPGGLPPMGYMAPLQGLVSMDGTTVPSAAIPPPHLLFQQPRLKRCATHCNIARNISFHQQFARMNPFWPAAAGSASLYGAKPCNLNVAPPTELHGNPSSRAANSGQDKGHGIAVFPGPVVKDKGSQAATMDNVQRKQILLQQALPPGPPSNILHGPAFIFPLNQQQAAAAASIRPGSVKSPPATGSGTTSSTSNAASVSTSGTGAAAAPTMSFSYPNIPANETQYLAILQNNAYPFPIPAHVGGPHAYRGTHAQALPFFNGSFYSSQMLHPSQLQQQQLPAQSQQQNQQGHQNASISSGSSSSQKHLQNQQQKPSANGSNSVGSGGGGGSLQGYPAPKIQPLQPLQQLHQQQVQQQQQLRQPLKNHHASHAARQIESEMGGEDSPSTADSRQSRATMSIYGQNYPMPMQPANFTLMTPASVGGGGATAGANGNHGDKKQSQSPKTGVETSQAFAMSFASINGATAAPGLDLSSFAQNHTILQSHNYQIMAPHAAQAAHQKKNYRISEEGKSGCDSSNPDDDRKAIGGKIPVTVGQSIAFSRPDVSDPSISPLTGNTVIDSSARSLNLGSASSRASVSVVPAATNNNATSNQLQRQHHNQQQQHHLIQLQKQQFAVATARSKTTSTSNGSVYTDHLPSTSAVAVKFPNSVSAFPQNLVQSSSTATQSPQWKNSARTTTSQSSSPSLASTPSSSVKALPQQQARTQPGHTQISFAANPKSSSAPQVQPSGSTQSPSPPVMVGSPTTSMSKSAGSPRTTSTSTSNKVGQASSLSSQQAKNSQAVPSHKSSPVGGRNIPSILTGPQLNQSSGTGVKPQLPQQQQQQISKQSLQQAQLLFSNAYMHPQASQSNNSTTTAASGYYLPRRGPEQQQRQGSYGTSSNGMLSLCPTVSLVNTSTSDSSKVVASAASLKGVSLPTQGLLHPAQFAAAQSSAGNHHQFVAPFSYVHAVPSAVQVKPAEQKQPAGE